MSGPDRLRDGQTFGRYQIVRRVGEGGMGAVYEAVHPVLKKRFAIKTLLPELANTAEARVRFLREGEAASTIDHPNVVNIADVGTEDGIPYLVMEFLEGRTLDELLGERGALDVAEALAILMPVISAVATGHQRGVIHRDLKPQNIFLARGPWGERIPKVLDFGVSKLIGDESATITRTLTVLGTAAYMSPEQARGARKVDFHSDQYSLGLILYEMLTGARAHAGDNSLEILHHVASGVITPLRQLRSNLPEALSVVVMKMLAVDRTDRHRTLSDVGRALLPFSDDKTRLAMTSAFGATHGRHDTTIAREATLDPPPSSPSGAGGTLPLPVPAPDSPFDTTLRQATGEARISEAAAASASGRRGRAGSPARLWGGLGAAAVLVAGLGSGWYALRSRGQAAAPGQLARRGPAARPVVAAAPAKAAAPPAAVPFAVRAIPAEAELSLDDAPGVRGQLQLILPTDESSGSSHQLTVSAPGYRSRVVTFSPGEPPPAEIRLEPEAPPARVPPRAPPARATARPAKPASGAPGRKLSEASSSPSDATPRRGSNNALILK